jgi:amino acid transporter
MEDFPAGMLGHGHNVQADDAQSIDSDRMNIYASNDNPSQIVTHAPKERFRLGYFDVLCLVVNFMIGEYKSCICRAQLLTDKILGTGVFNSHTRVMRGTDSTGAAMLLWFAGIIYCLCGTHVYIEYGLNVPRYTINGVEQSVPRSGGDLNYIQYVYRKPAYRKNTIALGTCLFGIGFIAFGNMAGNAINFAVCILRAGGTEHPDNGLVRGIAITCATLTCFIHAFSRRGGIWLNNMFALVKIAMLLLIVITAIVVAAHGLPESANYIEENTNPATAFDAKNTDANGYAHAFLAVIFSFWGFEQPNYILGEISKPKRKFPIAMSTGVAIVCVLYLAVTISYVSI